MANEISNSIIRPTHFNSLGKFLKSKREEKGLEDHEMAAQLRLRLKVITMLESDSYPEDLPITYIRGYIRSYGKLLEIPEHELKQAMELLQPSPLETHPEPEPVIIPPRPKIHPTHFRKVFITSLFFTLLIIMTWWLYPKEPTQNINLTMNNELSESSVNNPPLNLKPVVLAPQQIPTKHTAHKNFHIPGFPTLVLGKHATTQFFTYFLLFLLIGLAGLWFYDKNFSGFKTKSDNTQGDGNISLTNKAVHLSKLRIFSLIIFSTIGLAALWWSNYLLSVKPSRLAKKEPLQYTLPPQPLIFANHSEPSSPTSPSSTVNLPAEETLADAKSKPSSMHKLKLKMHAKNKMKQVIAPSLVEQYTPDDESQRQMNSHDDTSEMN